MNEIKSYGFIFEEPKTEDWNFGAIGVKRRKYFEAEVDWSLYRPSKEVQHTNVDTQGCVSWSLCNNLEYPMNFRIMNDECSLAELDWLEKHGFMDENGKMNIADLALAIVSNTNKNGNSLNRPAEAARKIGLVGESVFPFRKDAKTWEEMYKLPDEKVMRAMGEWLEVYKTNHEWVIKNPRLPQADKLKALIRSASYGVNQVAGYAWPSRDSEGRYKRVETRANHAFTEEQVYRPELIKVFDSYIVSDSNVKDLAMDYNIWQAKQHTISYIGLTKKYHQGVEVPENNEVKKFEEKINDNNVIRSGEGIWSILWQFISKYLKI